MKQSEFTEKLTNAFQHCPNMVEWKESDDSSNSTLHHQIKYLDGYPWDIYSRDHKEVNNTLSFFMFTGTQDEYNRFKNNKDYWDRVRLTNDLDFNNMFDNMLGEIHLCTLIDKLFDYSESINFAKFSSDNYDGFTIDYQGNKFDVKTIFRKNAGSIEMPELQYDFIIGRGGRYITIDYKPIPMKCDISYLYYRLLISILVEVYRDINEFNDLCKITQTTAFLDSMSELNKKMKATHLELFNENIAIIPFDSLRTGAQMI